MLASKAARLAAGGWRPAAGAVAAALLPLLLALGGLGLVACSAKRAPPPAVHDQAAHRGHTRIPEGVLSEEWHRLLLNDQPAGFMHEVVEKGPGGNLLTHVRQRLVVRRGEEPVQMEVETETEEEPQGALLRFRLVQNLAQNSLVTEGRVELGKLLVSAGSGAAAGAPRTPAAPGRTSEIPYDPRTLGPQALRRLLRDKLRLPGDRVEAVTFFPEKPACAGVTAVLEGEEELEFPSGPRKLQVRVTQSEILPGLDLREWVDVEGEVWRSSSKPMGMSVETYRSSASEILRERYASPPEVFYASSIRPSRPLGSPESAREVLYRFRMLEGDFASRGIDAMFRGTGQTVVREESPSTRVVRITAVSPERPVRRPVAPPPGMEDTAHPTTLVESDDPLIVELSRKAVGEETDAFTAALRLERWVRANVKFKDLKTPFASAREVAKSRVGDCTEHAVLLAALARAAGIPARLVSGLVYSEGVFLGHLWTEVYVDRWIPLDGTRGRGWVGPDHIALTASALSSSSMADLFLDLAHVVGNLSLEVLEER